jgi:rod shape-determining protein MreC
MNLVGRVIESSETESRVLPLLHEGFAVAGKVNEVNGVTFMVVGDAELKRQGLCLAKDIELFITITGNFSSYKHKPEMLSSPKASLKT